MSALRKTIAILMLLGDVVLGVYLGLFVFFIGGIIDLFDHESHHQITQGVLKLLLGSSVTFVVCVTVALIAIAIGWGHKPKDLRAKYKAGRSQAKSLRADAKGLRADVDAAFADDPFFRDMPGGSLFPRSQRQPESDDKP